MPQILLLLSWVLIPPNQLSVTADPSSYKRPRSSSPTPLLQYGSTSEPEEPRTRAGGLRGALGDPAGPTPSPTALPLPLLLSLSRFGRVQPPATPSQPCDAPGKCRAAAPGEERDAGLSWDQDGTVWGGWKWGWGPAVPRPLPLPGIPLPLHTHRPALGTLGAHGRGKRGIQQDTGRIQLCPLPHTKGQALTSHSPSPLAVMPPCPTLTPLCPSRSQHPLRCRWGCPQSRGGQRRRRRGRAPGH